MENFQQYPQMQPIYINKPRRPYTPEMEAEANRKARDSFWIFTIHLLLIPISSLLEFSGVMEINRLGLMLYYVVNSALFYGPLICLITLICSWAARDSYPENRKLKFVTRYETTITIGALALFAIFAAYISMRDIYMEFSI